jgi:hypothetical protein
VRQKACADRLPIRCEWMPGLCRIYLTGTYLAWSQPLSRSDAISWAMEVLAASEDDTVSGVTIFPADGSEPVYLSADDAKRPPGRRH